MADRPRRLPLLLVAAALLAGCDAVPSAAAGDASGPVVPEGPGSGAEAIAAAGTSFDCTPTRVWDGDGPIHCAEGPRIRLSGIAAREADGSCRPGHPCPASSAEAARDSLVALVGRRLAVAATGHTMVEGPTLRCTSEGSAGGKRTAAWCVSPTAGDLSCAMVASGTVLKWDRYWRDHSCG